jgi:hypothetical protein
MLYRILRKIYLIGPIQITFLMVIWTIAVGAHTDWRDTWASGIMLALFILGVLWNFALVTFASSEDTQAYLVYLIILLPFNAFVGLFCDAVILKAWL